MRDAKFATRILGEKGYTVSDAEIAEETERTTERQVGAFGVEIVFKDGRQGEGFPWHQYSGHSWGDDGEKEWVKIMFGERMLTIVGYHMRGLRHDVASGQLKTVRELNSRQVMLLRNENPKEEPIPERLTIEPSLAEIEKEIKGEEDDKHRHARRAAGR